LKSENSYKLILGGLTVMSMPVYK